MWFCQGITRGLTVLKKDGVYRAVDFPYQGDCDDADIVYLGGHVYDVSNEEAAALAAWLAEEELPPGPPDPPPLIEYWWDSLDLPTVAWDSLQTWDNPL